MSITYEKLLLLKNARVNLNLGLNELCPMHVNIGLGLNQGQFLFEGKWYWDWEKEKWKHFYSMREYPPIEVSDEYSTRSWDWEIQAQFFKSNNLIPHWIDDYSHYGFLKLILNNTVDYSPVPDFVYTDTDLNALADSSSVIKNPQYHWMTRKPGQLSLTWNLLYLFPFDLWILTFVAILLVSQLMRLSSKIYKKFNVRVITTELLLIPLRSQSIHSRLTFLIFFNFKSTGT